MKITVDRVRDTEDNLVFTITVSEPHDVSLSDDEISIMTILQNTITLMDQYNTPKNKVKERTLIHLQQNKEEVFMQVLKKLRFSIDEQLRPKFMPILQEIYNWIYDKQTDWTKRWLEEFDPQRSRYYFDNEKTIEDSDPQESEHEGEDEDEDTDMEDEDSCL